MKKVLLVFSVIFCLLFTYTTPHLTVNLEPSLLTSDNVIQPRGICLNQDSIVTIVDTKGEIVSSGVIMYKSDYNYYIATTYEIYDKNSSYEIIFNDYARYSANIVGVSKDDGVFILKCIIQNKNYCIANTSGNLKTYVGEKVNVFARKDYREVIDTTYVNAVGICKNCGEETYKNYFYSRLTLEIEESSLGAGIYNLDNQLVGMVTGYLKDFKYGVSYIDSNRILDIVTKYETTGEYKKNYIRYNLLNVSELSMYEKYLYSIDNQSAGVLVSSIHYLNYFTFGLNQSMIIIGVNGIRVNNVYEFDYEISKYHKGSYLELKVRTIVGLYRTIKVKI